jgi:hypothetical protein
MTAALGAWTVAWGDAIAKVLEEDDEWGTTTMRPRLLTWLRSFTDAADRSGAFPGLRVLAGRRTARAAIGALAGDGHRGLPGPRPARFGAGSGA